MSKNKRKLHPFYKDMLDLNPDLDFILFEKEIEEARKQAEKDMKLSKDAKKNK